MNKNTTGQNDDFESDWGDEAAPDEPETTDGAGDQGDEVDPDRDPNALPVTLKTGTFNGEDCVEFYAHGEAMSYETGKMTKRSVLLARVSERELTMFPLHANSLRHDFLEPKYEELASLSFPSTAGFGGSRSRFAISKRFSKSCRRASPGAPSTDSVSGGNTG